MRSEDLVRLCDERLAGHTVAAEMTFTDTHLVFGAGTRLAKLGAPLDEPRLAALLTSAHGGPIEAARLAHVRRAVETRGEGDRAPALTHLALSRLEKLGDPIGGARQLFLADALMDSGVTPGVIITGMTREMMVEGASIAKYSPDQPRVPAGNSDGGQWTTSTVGDEQSVRDARDGGAQIEELLRFRPDTQIQTPKSIDHKPMPRQHHDRQFLFPVPVISLLM